jgi:hypothetical protein
MLLHIHHMDIHSEATPKAPNPLFRWPLKLAMVIVVLAATVIFASQIYVPHTPLPANEPSAERNWLTYQDRQGVFTFQYPPGFNVGRESSSTIVYAASAPNPYEDNLEFSGLITRTTEPTTYAFSHGGLPMDYEFFSYDRTATLNGLTVFEYGVLRARGTAAHTFFLRDENHGVDATYEATSPLATEFGQVVSTFRFSGT